MTKQAPPNRAVFDLELARPLPENGKGTDWKAAHNCGISTLVMWPMASIHPFIAIMDSSRFPLMLLTEDWIAERFRACDGVVSWNGLDFDLRVVKKQAPEVYAAIKDVRHVDLMAVAAAVQANAKPAELIAGLEPGWAQKYPSIRGDWLSRGWNLNLVYKATLGSEQGKLVGFDGAEAPIKWQSGQYSGVITYCVGDVALTRELYRFAWDNGYLISPERGKVLIPREYL